jgi:transposase
MIIGVDVSKGTLDHCTRDGHPSQVANSAKPVKRFLSKLPAGTVLAMEATGRYHRLLADTAHSMGFTVIVFNPKDVHRYAKSISPRATTDPIAARVIAEFASVRKHRPYVPLPAFAEALRDLVRTRAGLVKERVALENQASEHAGIAEYLADAVASIGKSVAKLEKQIVEAAKCRLEYRLLLKIPGFGPIVSSYMMAMLASGEFASSDAFVAFVGLDLRVRESGKLKGRRKLSKRGDPEARHLLHLAALAASQQPGPFSELRARHLERGLSKTEAAVIIARKLARVAWAVYTKQQAYDAQRVLNQPSQNRIPSEISQNSITYAATDPLDKQIANAVIAAARTNSFHDNPKPTDTNRGAHAQEPGLDTAA